MKLTLQVLCCLGSTGMIAHQSVLEMIRLKVLRVFQSGAGGPIRVYRRDRPAEAPRPIEYHDPHAAPHGTPAPQP